jgi:hypothetical protein
MHFQMRSPDGCPDNVRRLVIFPFESQADCYRFFFPVALLPPFVIPFVLVVTMTVVCAV